MKRVRHFTAVGDDTTIKLTVEITTNKGCDWNRKTFLENVEYLACCVMMDLAELGFPLTKIKQSTVRK